MRYVALKDIPNGIPAGQEFEATEAEGEVLLLVGAVKLAEPRARNRYARRDMVAAGKSTVDADRDDES